MFKWRIRPKVWIIGSVNFFVLSDISTSIDPYRFFSAEDKGSFKCQNVLKTIF